MTEAERMMLDDAIKACFIAEEMLIKLRRQVMFLSGMCGGLFASLLYFAVR